MKMSKECNPDLYSKSLRDFINNDVKVIQTKNFFYFVSKKEDYIFRKYRKSEVFIQIDDQWMHSIDIFMVWDKVYSEIINLRNDNNEKI